MPTFGHLKRDFPRLEVLRGFDPNEPRTQTAAYRVKSGETILSGMVITPRWNAGDSVYEWAVGIGAVSDYYPIYFALQDSTDEDVLEAGNLVGLSCAGQFELQTAFYDPADTYNEGSLLTACLDATDEAIAAAVLTALGRSSGAGDGKGFVTVVSNPRTLSEGGDNTLAPVIGQVTRAASNGSTTVESIDGINSNVVFKSVITFRTMYQPAIAIAN